MIGHSLFLLFLTLLINGCSGGGNNATPSTDTNSPSNDGQNSSVDNQLSYDTASRRLTSGIVDIIGDTRGHYEVDFQTSDGEFMIGTYTLFGVLYTYWFAQNDTALFSADLYSPSRSSLETGEYRYVDISEIRGGDSTIGLAVFSQSKVGWDFNNDGDVDDDEKLDVVGGSVTFSGASLTDAELQFDVLLTNGLRVNGSYSNGFMLVD